MNNPYYTFPEPPKEPELLPSNAADPAEVRLHFSKVGLAYLVMTVAYMVAAYVIQFAVAFGYPILYETWWFRWAVSLVPLYAVGLPALLLCLRRVPVSPHNVDFTIKGSSSEKPRLRLKQWLILLVVAFGCMTAGGLVGNTIMSILSAVMQYDYAFALNSMVTDTPVWFTLICTCICAPFGEELLFRKLLIDRTRRYGDMTAILFSGLLFGLFHGNLFQFFYAALVGMVLAYVYTRSGSYLRCVAMHAAINFMGSVVTPALSQLMTPLTSGEMFTEGWMPDAGFLVALLAYLLLMLWQYGMLIAGIVLFCVCFKNRKLSRGATPLGVSCRYDATLFNPGMIACVVVLLLVVLVNLIPAR